MTAAAARLEAAWLAAPDVRRVMRALARDGHEARFVGGCVRDALIDPTDPGQDIDLATPERPERVMALLADAGLTPLPTGLRHGTVSVQGRGRRFEITTLRRDLACDGRHAEVAFTDNFDADAARRDFTINAMSCAGDGTLHDPVGGRADLAAGRVRFVGEARRRIAEDYLRILRFFRFQARFGRGPADPEALAACADEAAGIDRLSGERIRHELWRILSGPRAGATLALMRSVGVLERILPGVATEVGVERLDPADPLLRLAALLRPTDARRVEAVAERLKLSNDERDRLVALAATPFSDFGTDRRGTRRQLYRLGSAAYSDLVRLAAAAGRIDGACAASLLGTAAAWREPVLPLRGADLLALGVAPGPTLGALLAQVRAAWESSDFNLDREACLALARELVTARSFDSAG